MKLTLDIHFQTDGDFSFQNLSKLIDVDSIFYKGAITRFWTHDDYCNDIDVQLDCNGDANECRWAARDILEHLVCNGIRTCHYYLVKELYDFIITPLESYLWSDEDVHYYQTFDHGNYIGTYLQLDIEH